jgi:hypothetical protein
MTKKMVIALSLILASGLVMAQPKKGSSELELSGNFTAADDFTTVFANVNYGYFFSSQFRWNVGLSAFGTDIDGGDSNINVGARTGVAYHFNDTGDTAYVSGNYYVQDVDMLSETQSVEALIGYRTYISDSTALFYEAGYRHLIDASEGAVVGNFGITFLFD